MQIDTTNQPSLDWYLNAGYSIQDIVKKYILDLKEYGKKTKDEVELAHAAFLESYYGVITNSTFLDKIQGDLESFLDHLSRNNSLFSFGFNGRIKSLFRTEQKFNGYIKGFCLSFYNSHNRYPTKKQIVRYLTRVRDTIGFQLIIESKNHNISEEEALLAKIANFIPIYFDSSSLDAEAIGGYEILKASELIETGENGFDSMLEEKNRPFFKDYVSNPKGSGYRAYHLNMLHVFSQRIFEMKLMTLDMHVKNEFEAPHILYEEKQKEKRTTDIPLHASAQLIRAHERIMRLHDVKYEDIKVNMFHAIDKEHFKDFCGLIHPRLTKPIELL